MALRGLKYTHILILVLPSTANHGTETVKIHRILILVLPSTANHGTETVKTHLYLNFSAAYLG